MTLKQNEVIRRLNVIDTHTEGMATRVVIDGFPLPPGRNMREMWSHAPQTLQATADLLLSEPRGNPALSVAFLISPRDRSCNWGFLYADRSGFMPMCGHATIGVATALIETGIIDSRDSDVVLDLDTPAGVVGIRAHVKNERVLNVAVRNVPSFLLRSNATIQVPKFGEISYALAFGGNFYPIVTASELRLDFDTASEEEFATVGMSVIDAINSADPPRHPEIAEIVGCHHLQIVDPRSTPTKARTATVISPGWLDRSPCGTGTSARLAYLIATGQLERDKAFTNESLIGGRFSCRAVEDTTVADIDAVVPEISGRAWITSTATQVLYGDDPFPKGFRL